jgi:hypothetical protein
MQKIDWRRKLTSRKFWVALAGIVSGLILIFGGEEEKAKTAYGVILEAFSILGYMLAESKADAAWGYTEEGSDDENAK